MRKNANYPILDFDPEKKAVIEPSRIYKRIEKSEYCILCFYLDTVKKIAKEHDAVPVFKITGQGEPIVLYRLNYKDRHVLFVFPGIGAPLAGAVLEVCIALGVRKVIAFGSAGVLDNKIKRNRIIVLDSAVRDEGTSYHYMPPSLVVKADENVLRVMESVLNDRKVSYMKGKAWTTDAFFRETANKVKRRKEQGCIAVEMESASLMAIARFRDISYGHFIGSADDVSREEWDERDAYKQKGFKERMFWLAVDICLAL